VPKLTIQDGLQKGRVISVAGPTVIGRGAAADLSLPDAGVSRRHAQLTVENGEWRIEDLGSANGTVINGRPVRGATTLHDGDLIGVGTVLVQYSGERESAAASHTRQVRVHDDGREHSVVHSISELQRPGSEVDEATWLRLLEGSARISTLALDETALASFVVGEILALLPHADRIALLVDESGELVPRATTTRSGTESGVATSRRLLDDVIARREAVLAIDVQADPRFAPSDSMVSLGRRSVLCAPILFQQQIYGVLHVDTAASGVPFDKADLALVHSLASQIGMALGYARLHAAVLAQQLVEHDLALAQKIQQHFLCDASLSLPGYSLAVEYRPALAVGGDVYDIIDLEACRIALAVGDVSGKGVSAALLAARLGTDLRYQAAGQPGPAEILARVNRVLAQRDLEGMFVTAAMAVLDPATGTLALASAGHPPPLVRGRDGTVTTLGGAVDSDCPLGLNADVRFSERESRLAPGDVLVMYTDGVVEALDVSQQIFGEPRLIDAIRQAPGDAPAVCRAIVDAVRQFVGSAPQSDDVTILCLGRQ
jgi:sigma-B regulation protein RsbU (phosphoserine phosphatase)